MNAFKAIRLKLKMSQEEIGLALGKSQGNISFYEGGQTIPPEVARKLIEVAASRGEQISFDDVYGNEPAAA